MEEIIQGIVFGAARLHSKNVCMAKFGLDTAEHELSEVHRWMDLSFRMGILNDRVRGHLIKAFSNSQQGPLIPAFSNRFAETKQKREPKSRGEEAQGCR